MAKMKNNQDGGGVNASDPKAAGKSIEKIEKGAAKHKDGHVESKGGERAKTADKRVGARPPKQDKPRPPKGAAKYKGSADGHKMDEKKGAAKYKGAHDYDTSKGSHGHDSKGGHGAARMGYTQSFGPARMNGYAKGAARVADIMTNGASKKMHGAADAGHGGKEGHEHSLFDLDRAKRVASRVGNTAMKVGRTALRTAGDVGMQALDFIQLDPKNVGSGGNSDGFNLGGSRAAMSDAFRAKDQENRHYNKTRQMVKEGKIYDTGLADKFDDSGFVQGGFNEEHNSEGFGGILPSGKRNPKYKGSSGM